MPFPILRILAIGTAATMAASAHSEDLHGKDAAADQVRQAMRDFQVAIRGKKEADILALFVNADAPVIGSASDQTIARIRTKKADASKVLYSTSRKFASQVAADKDSSEETYSDVSINADDAVASISFNFVFLSNGAPANLGKEAWLMVKTDAGWKISSIAYSMNFPGK
jgi:hypothetical protein